MSNQFLGEIRLFGGNFAPRTWALCNGQLMSIAQNNALFSLLGTTYGGDGVTTFALPNVQGRLPMGQGAGPGLTPRQLGEMAGTENVTLTTQNLPVHNHSFNASTQAANGILIGPSVLPGTLTDPANFYTDPTQSNPPAPTMGTLVPQSIGMTGGNQPHSNMMPSLCVTFIIALQGIFPSRN